MRSGYIIYAFQKMHEEKAGVDEEIIFYCLNYGEGEFIKRQPKIMHVRYRGRLTNSVTEND